MSSSKFFVSSCTEKLGLHSLEAKRRLKRQIWIKPVHYSARVVRLQCMYNKVPATPPPSISTPAQVNSTRRVSSLFYDRNVTTRHVLMTARSNCNNITKIYHFLLFYVCILSPSVPSLTLFDLMMLRPQKSQDRF